MSGVASQLGALATMSPAQLRSEWTRVYESAPPAISSDLLHHGIAFELQRKSSGKKEASLARLLRQRPLPNLRPGTELVRTWNGRTIRVQATEDGFLFEDRLWTSLSAIARAVTGTAQSGPLFFGLRGRG